MLLQKYSSILSKSHAFVYLYSQETRTHTAFSCSTLALPASTVRRKPTGAISGQDHFLTVGLRWPSLSASAIRSHCSRSCANLPVFWRTFLTFSLFQLKKWQQFTHWLWNQEKAVVIWWHSSSRLRLNAPAAQASRAPGFRPGGAATQLSARPAGLGVAASGALRVVEGKGFASNFIPQTPAVYTPPAQGGSQLRLPSAEPGRACRSHREPASHGAWDKNKAKGKENLSEQRKGRERSDSPRPPSGAGAPPHGAAAGAAPPRNAPRALRCHPCPADLLAAPQQPRAGPRRPFSPRGLHLPAGPAETCGPSAALRVAVPGPRTTAPAVPAPPRLLPASFSSPR